MRRFFRVFRPWNEEESHQQGITQKLDLAISCPNKNRTEMPSKNQLRGLNWTPGEHTVFVANLDWSVAWRPCGAKGEHWCRISLHQEPNMFRGNDDLSYVIVDDCGFFHGLPPHFRHESWQFKSPPFLEGGWSPALSGLSRGGRIKGSRPDDGNHPVCWVDKNVDFKGIRPGILW